jgi:hypothetical protein
MLVASLGLLFFATGARGVEPPFMWDDRYDGGVGAVDYGTSAIVMSGSGDLVVGGEMQDYFAGSDMVIRRLDRISGQEVWSAMWGVPDGNDMALVGLVEDGEGNVLVGGYIRGCPT